MKKLFTILFLLSAFISNAQQSFFRGNNNYVVPPAPPFQAPNIVQAGLVLNLDAGNPASYSGTGNTWANLVTGNAVADFTLSGGTYARNDGGVIRFENSGGYASSSTGFANLTAYTVEVWVKMAGTRGDYDPTVLGNTNYTPCLFSEMYANGAINMVLAYNARGLTSGTANNSYRYEGAIYNNGWNSYQIGTDYSSDLNNWIQLLVTYDGSKLTIYRNGLSLGASSALNIGSLLPTSAGYFIAHRWDMSDGVYGDYSIVNMYNRALSPSEVTTNFDAVKSRFGFTSVPSSSAQVPTISSTTGKTWMDRNLGASQVATSLTDAASFGDLYQWGRGTDGHEKRISVTTSSLSNLDVPGDAKFITTSNGDWRSAQNDNLWQGVNGINNPCPAGFRLPTATEWIAEHATWSSQNKNEDGAFASPLKLPKAGWRGDNGTIRGPSSGGLYWSSTASVSNPGRARPIVFDTNYLSIGDNARSYGFSVRCIQH